jgi:AhpD family alkylhydroperoxidase
MPSRTSQVQGPVVHITASHRHGLANAGVEYVRPITSSQVSARLDFDAAAADFSRAMGQLDQAAMKQLDKVDFDPKLRELVRVRASQLNGCAYCIDMHTKDARAIGESENRLYALPAWRDTTFFSEAERAALALTEAVTRGAAEDVWDHVWKAARAQFSTEELGALVSLIVTINAWNNIGASTRAWEAGSYQP